PRTVGRQSAPEGKPGGAEPRGAAKDGRGDSGQAVPRTRSRGSPARQQTQEGHPCHAGPDEGGPAGAGGTRGVPLPDWPPGEKGARRSGPKRPRWHRRRNTLGDHYQVSTVGVDYGGFGTAGGARTDTAPPSVASSQSLHGWYSFWITRPCRD